ncbi:hypothetical protein PGT21_004418 [Puccinia graminis f. sp. tritici]|uniref:Uncharacterized protein n=1 Tax=Puccinia graminis f. sp. tritici TaxID=56615 RepID=A0A5B0PKC1_PUCGR|nr:hypothetical protein PGT21_004418 [Puccinia graminis f. sp. tritici]
MTAAVQCCDALRLRSDGSRRSFACEFGRADYVNLSRRGEGRRGSSQMTLYSLRTQWLVTPSGLQQHLASRAIRASPAEPRLGNFQPKSAARARISGSSRAATRPSINRPSPRPRLEVQGNSRLGRDRPLTYSLFSSSHTPTPPTPQCSTRYFNNKLRLLHKNHRPFQ